MSKAGERQRAKARTARRRAIDRGRLGEARSQLDSAEAA
jgi:hypothetical protein